MAENMWSKAEQEGMLRAIERRKSSRSFKAESLPKETLTAVKEKINRMVPLFSESRIAFRILSSEEVKGRVSDKAHYVIGYAEHGLENYANLGFMMEQLVLWLTDKGIATWWHGLIHPLPEYAEADGLPFAFMFTFGISDGDALRNKGQFNRKSIRQISDMAGFDNLLEAVRLAPSGRNVQPWYITGSSSELFLFNTKENALIRKVAPDVEYINAGIALCHLWLAASKEGLKTIFKRDSDQRERSKKSEYICTITLLNEE